MTDANDETRKRDKVKQGFHKVTSKLGFSSRSQAEPSVYNGVAMPIPIVQAHSYNDPQYYAAPPWTNGGYSDDRGRPISGATGQQTSAQNIRLNNTSNQGNDDKDKKNKKPKVDGNTAGPKKDGKKKTQ